MSSILWQNDDKTVVVIDIPASIAEAQGSGQLGPKLVSCEPIQNPWHANEPKSESSRAKLRTQQHESDVYAARTAEIALAEANANYDGLYCLERCIPTTAASTGLKRPRPGSPGGDALNDLPGYHHKRRSGKVREWYLEADTSVDSLLDTSDCLVSNATSGTVNLTVRDTGAGYAIPANSAFYLGDCADAVPFHRAIQQHPAHPLNSIVMDPPWPSASIRRGGQKGQPHYSVTSSLADMRELLWSMDIGSLLAADGVLAIWITNKPSVRELVLGSGGLFDECGIHLKEEWLLLKVTAKGVPVLPIDGLWRKPYEILLVGSKVEPKPVKPRVRRRVLLAVPDLHSRKPCLKRLLEQTFSMDTYHYGLEIFARHLVSGWVSWGNDVLRFNNHARWQDDGVCTGSSPVHDSL